MTAFSSTSPLIVLKQRLRAIPRGLLIVALVLAVMAIWLGIASVATRTTSPVDRKTPRMLVHTTPPPGPPTQHA